MFKSVTEQLAGHAGFDMTATWRMESLPYTRRLQGLFQHFGITSVIDVGANAGQFRDQMRRETGFTGPIFSFEPNPILAAGLLQRAMEDLAWIIFSMALGAEAGMMPLNVTQNPVFNPFDAPATAVSLQQKHVGGRSMQASIDAFAVLGFAIADLFLVSTDGDHRAVEFDCVMVRDRQAG